MKSFVAALITLAVIGIASYSVLDGKIQRTSEQAYTTTGARIDPAGH